MQPSAFCLQMGKGVGPLSGVAETLLGEELLSAHPSLSSPCLRAVGQDSLQSHLDLSSFPPAASAYFLFPVP